MQKQFEKTVQKSDFPAICLMVSQLDHDDTGFAEKEQAIISRAMEFIDGMPALKLFLSSSPFKDTDHRAIQAYVRKNGLRLGGEFETLINSMHPRNDLFRETMATVVQEARKLLAAMDRQNSPEELVELSYVVMANPDDADQKKSAQSLRKLMLPKVTKYPIEKVLDWAQRSASWLNHDIIEHAAKRPGLGAEDVGKLLHIIKNPADPAVLKLMESLNRVAVKALDAQCVTSEALQQIASAIFDRSENGSASEALETAIIRILVPRAKTVPEAIEMAGYFSTKTGRNRFIETFASQHGVKSQAEATDLFLAVRGPDGHFRTSEALQAVIKAAKKSGVKIEAEPLRGLRNEQQEQALRGKTLELAKLALLKMILSGGARPSRPTEDPMASAQQAANAMQQLIERALREGQIENIRVADPETGTPLTLAEMLAKHGSTMPEVIVKVFRQYAPLQFPERHGNA